MNKSPLAVNLQSFFKGRDGNLFFLNKVKRPDFETLIPSGDGNIFAYSAHVAFENSTILGEKGDYLEEVYPRLNYLQKELNDFLRKNHSNENNIRVSIVPYLSPNATPKGSLPKLENQSRGKDIVDMELLSKHSPYYKDLNKEYNIKYGVVTSNGTVVGPDGGLIAAACSIAETFEKKVD